MQKNAGLRELKNTSLRYLADLNYVKLNELASKQFSKATNLTDKVSALSIMVDNGIKGKDKALSSFENEYKQNQLVTNTWFTIQAGATGKDTLDKVKKLTEHEKFGPYKTQTLIALLLEHFQLMLRASTRKMVQATSS